VGASTWNEMKMASPEPIYIRETAVPLEGDGTVCDQGCQRAHSAEYLRPSDSPVASRARLRARVEARRKVRPRAQPCAFRSAAGCRDGCAREPGVCGRASVIWNEMN